VRPHQAKHSPFLQPGLTYDRLEPISRGIKRLSVSDFVYLMTSRPKTFRAYTSSLTVVGKATYPVSAFCVIIFQFEIKAKYPCLDRNKLFRSLMIGVPQQTGIETMSRQSGIAHAKEYVAFAIYTPEHIHSPFSRFYNDLWQFKNCPRLLRFSCRVPQKTAPNRLFERIVYLPGNKKQSF